MRTNTRTNTLNQVNRTDGGPARFAGRLVEAAAPDLQGHLAGAPLRAPAADASRASAIASWARRVRKYFG